MHDCRGYLSCGINVEIQRRVSCTIHQYGCCRTSDDSTIGKIYNVGPERPTSIREVVERTSVALGVRFEDLCMVTEDRLGQDSRYWLDSTRIRTDLGWKPEIGWGEGLAEMVAWGYEHRDEICRTPTEYLLRA